ncbi:MAG: hypothetical protein ABJA57_04200 [Ginsengibacter sp.]
MKAPQLVKSGILTLVLVVVSLASWEFYLRNKGITTDYDDGESLWSDKRAMVYGAIDQSTVFIGSSRIKYDLDIETWIAITGDQPIQLAIEGNSPRPVLEDLANDKNFKGRVVVDVTEGLFFSSSPNNNSDPEGRIAYYKKRTPAQRFSFLVNHALESQFVFLDKSNFSLASLIDRVPVKKRNGVFAMPCEFPMDFGRVTFDRQDVMTKKFLSDTNLQNQVKGIWQFFGKINDELPASGKKLDSVMMSVKAACDKIKSRGGQVLFVRTPSSGPYFEAEIKGFPRAKYWDQLLKITNCPGIHFKDYPPIDHFQCPEFSHLSPSDAIIFTKNFIKILVEEKNWHFKKQITTPVTGLF